MLGIDNQTPLGLPAVQRKLPGSVGRDRGLILKRGMTHSAPECQKPAAPIQRTIHKCTLSKSILQVFIRNGPPNPVGISRSKASQKGREARCGCTGRQRIRSVHVRFYEKFHFGNVILKYFFKIICPLLKKTQLIQCTASTALGALL
jgi:hypothetical protein